MTHPPKPPTEDDLPEEFSIVDVPTESSPTGGRRSRGAAGIIIAAVLGCISAIGLFFAFKPYLLPPAVSPPAVDDSSESSDSKLVLHETKQPPVRKEISGQKPAARSPAEGGNPNSGTVRNESLSSDSQTKVATNGQPNPKEAPFSGSNSKPNNVPPLELGKIPETTRNSPPVTAVPDPKPDSEALEQARREIDGVFSAQIREAKTREEKMIQANVLKQAAQGEPAGSPTRFVLLESAIDLAVDAPDSRLTNEFISLLATEFDVDPYDYNLRAVDEWYRMEIPNLDAAAELELHRLIARMASILGDQAYERKDFKTAATMYAIASKRRNRADDKEISDLLGKKRTDARTKETRQSLVASLLTELETAPQDAGKHLEAGIACLQNGLWEQGLDCLAKGNDESLKQFAQEQLSLRANSQTRLQAGDHSWDAVRTLDRRHSLWLKELAVANYESVFTELTRLQFLKVKPRLQQVGPVSCVLPVGIQHFAFDPDDFVEIAKTPVVRNHLGHYGNGRLYGRRKLELGVRGTALALDGRQNLMSCPRSENLILGDSPLTIAIWIKVDRPLNTAIAGRMFRESSRVTPDFQLRLMETNRCVAMVHPENGGAISLESRDPVPQGQWVHLAMTWDMESLKLYLDGRETASQRVSRPYSQRVLANRNWIAVGGEKPPNYTASKFQGLIDELRIYDQALSPLQIFHVYLQDQAPEH